VFLDEVEVRAVQRCPDLGWIVELWWEPTSIMAVVSRLDGQTEWSLDCAYRREVISGQTVTSPPLFPRESNEMTDDRPRHSLSDQLTILCDRAVNAASQLG